MKVIDIIKGEKPSLSFEVFPPKTSDNFESVMKAATEIAELKPGFMSVTYGAGGGTSEYTADIAEAIDRLGVTPIAHLSCISSTKEQIKSILEKLKNRKIENILALRGDIPKEGLPERMEYHYASELAAEIRGFGGFCIGGACYPENHPESKNSIEDIDNLKKKVECGCEFLTTQMFFDNNILYNFMYRLLRANVDVPVVAGIMPVTNAAQIKRICSISGNTLPQRFLRLVDRYGDNPDAMKQAGIAYATEQIIDLFANGINAVHIYSMNKPDVAAAIQSNLSEIIK
ncbi:MAG: methylenetetrahydrofolate reductase [Clostridia bacterium]|nr:methylenetetrahydrofolate reductase [NAD(P)H] [Oscillospiraceae bacterium]MBQ7960841.1 methylenetetrahydrofolate reductase [NAD(P)H] [Clostridia bacterium]